MILLMRVIISPSHHENAHESVMVTQAGHPQVISAISTTHQYFLLTTTTIIIIIILIIIIIIMVSIIITVVRMSVWE